MPYESRPANPNTATLQPAKNLIFIVYVLQAATFITLLAFIAGAVISYVKRDVVQGTWLESHFRWQARTFWYSLLWTVVGTLTIWLVVGYVVLFAASVWLIYRIGRGLIYLHDNRPLYG